MLISIRGSNGSGKSSIVVGLMKLGKWSLQYGLLGPRKPEAYHLPPKMIKGIDKPLYVLGPYVTPTGGLDNVQPYDNNLELIKKYAAKGHVVFEGVLVSSSYGRVGRLLEEWGQDAVMGFMDTPLEKCIANVQKRRDARGDDREFNPKNLTSKYNQIVKSKVKIADEGKLRVVDLEFGRALDQVLALLRNAK